MAVTRSASILNDRDRSRRVAVHPGGDRDVDGPDECSRVRHAGVQRHDVQVVGVGREKAVDQVSRPGSRPFRVIVVSRWKVASPSAARRAAVARRPGSGQRAVVAFADTPPVQEQAGQVTDVIGVQVGEEHCLQAGEAESRVGERGRRPPTTVDNEDPVAHDERRRDPRRPATGRGAPAVPRSTSSVMPSHSVQAVPELPALATFQLADARSQAHADAVVPT